MGKLAMNRRGFLRQTAKVAAGIIAANSIPIALDAIPVSVARMIPVAEPSPIYEYTGEAWKEVGFQVHDLTGWTTISREMMTDCCVPLELMIRHE